MWLVAPTCRPYSSSNAEHARARAARRARDEHERVADERARAGWRGLRGDRRGDEAVRRALEQRHLLQAAARSASGSRSRQSSSTSEPWRRSRMPALRRRRKRGEQARLRQRRRARRSRSARPARAARPCAASRARHVAHARAPSVAPRRRAVAGAARHEPAHRVPDERDLLDLHRPRVDERLEQVGERAAVLGDVAAGVVADVDRREAELAREARAVVRRPAARSRHACSVPISPWTNTTSRGVASGKASASASRSSGDGPAADADGHRLLERAVLALQRSPTSPLSDAEHRGAARRRRERRARRARRRRASARRRGRRRWPRRAARRRRRRAIASCASRTGRAAGPTAPNARSATARCILPMPPARRPSSSKARRTSARTSSGAEGDPVMAPCNTIGCADAKRRGRRWPAPSGVAGCRAGRARPA